MSKLIYDKISCPVEYTSPVTRHWAVKFSILCASYEPGGSIEDIFEDDLE